MLVQQVINIAGSPSPKRLREVKRAIKRIVWPLKGDGFYLAPLRTKHENGVETMKRQFRLNIERENWTAERRVTKTEVSGFPPGPLDAWHDDSRTALEWETGNVASVQRSANKLHRSLTSKFAREAILVVPANAMKPYLTDRVANVGELEPYFDGWRDVPEGTAFTVIVVTFDAIVPGTPLLPKINSGQSKRRIPFFEVHLTDGQGERVRVGVAAMDTTEAELMAVEAISADETIDADEFTVSRCEPTQLFAYVPLVYEVRKAA